MPIGTNLINAGNFIVRNIPKAIGIGALGIIGSDAHFIAKYEADTYATAKDADATMYYLHNSMISDSLSKTEGAIKDAAYHMELDQSWRRFFNLGIGYTKSFTSMLVSNVVPLGLGITAILTKGMPSKIAAGATVLYGLAKGIKAFFGIGNPSSGLE